MKKLFLATAFLGHSVITGAFAQSLDDVVRNGTLHNPQVRAEMAKYQSYLHDLREGKADNLPQIDLNAGYGYEEVYTPTTDTTGDGLNRRELSLKLTQNLFRGWGTQANLKRLKARADAQALYARSVASDIALDITKAYLEIKRSRELVRLAQLNRENHVKILQQIQARFDSGLSDEVELDQAKGRLALAEANLIAEQSKLADSRARYHRLVGDEAPDQLDLPDFPQDAIPKDLETTIGLALVEHPRLLSAYADVAEARAQALASKAANYPVINAEIERRWDENISGQKGPNEDLQAMIRARYNLYRGGGDQARIKSTEALLQQAIEIRNKTRREVMENLRYAWNTMTMATTQMQYLDQHIQLTRNTLLGYRKQFSLGRRSLLDLLNTESEYNKALTQMTNTRYDLLIAQYRILNGMGRLLDHLKVPFKLGVDELPVSAYLDQ